MATKKTKQRITPRRTKIVATIGPATAQTNVLRSVLKSGVDVCRLNFSHGTHKTHRDAIRMIRDAADASGRRIALLADLGGPKVRLGDVDEGVRLTAKAQVRFSHRAVLGTSEVLSVTYPKILNQLKKGMDVFIDDGRVRLRVIRQEKEKGQVLLRVLHGGPLRSRAGLAVRGLTFDVPAFTKKDKEDLKFALRERVDAVAVSFVKQASDVRRVRRALPKKNPPLVFAKIETPSAVDDIEHIVAESDGIMIARGDLGSTIDAVHVPHIQKRIIRLCLGTGTPVITATHMLESMTHAATATRAEVADVTNAILDGTDAVMLSGETATGEHPKQAVRVMEAIAHRTDPAVSGRMFPTILNQNNDVPDAVGAAILRAADRAAAPVLAVFTDTGRSARLVSRYRPNEPIVALSPYDHVLRQLVFSRGVIPIKTEALRSVEHMIEATSRALRELGVKRGTRFVVGAGIPFRTAGTTNLIHVGEVQ